ncbi:DsbA family protein [Desertivirga arenae]|uniref:DsbA family protein n=1 Tax=Desertivirga arenae TaxID=2810309 RepID=UPI001A97B316|nr:DsbA family protein [Pedobacter sp. SYSU D00823]
MQLKFIYIYDALCTWCYGFSPVIKAVRDKYKDVFEFEILSGGMITGTRTGPVSVVYPTFKDDYKQVEELTGIDFGEAFLHELDKGSMIFDSERPSIALSVFKLAMPQRVFDFIYDLQQSIFYEGKDPNSDELYRYHAVNFGIDPDQFIYNMHLEQFKQDAYYEFALARQLQVNNYPAAFIQSSDNHFFMVARGFATLETMELRIDNVLKELEAKQ